VRRAWGKARLYLLIGRHVPYHILGLRVARKSGPIGCHTFRATGITDYLTNGGRIEVAQRMAGRTLRRPGFTTGATMMWAWVKWRG